MECGARNYAPGWISNLLWEAVMEGEARNYAPE